MNDLVLSVTDFLSMLNQTLETAYPLATVEGELAEFRVSKGRWLYFKLKDETATLNCFGSIYQLPGPLEDGMVIKVAGSPRNHLQYGFSFNVQNIAVSGEGSLKKAQDLLLQKLTKEGLFEQSRKRPLPAIPESVGLITSRGSAAEADFLKIIAERWGGITIVRRDSLVQGVDAPAQLIASIEAFNRSPSPPEVLVVVRGGGSQDDLAAFSDERVVRAVAGSRIPTLIAIGHEVDVSLAELAADMRASTPTNAAQLLVPERKYEIGEAWGRVEQVGSSIGRILQEQKSGLQQVLSSIQMSSDAVLANARSILIAHQQLIESYNPTEILRRGYSLIRKADKTVRSAKQLSSGDPVIVQFHDGKKGAIIS